MICCMLVPDLVMVSWDVPLHGGLHQPKKFFLLVGGNRTGAGACGPLPLYILRSRIIIASNEGKGQYEFTMYVVTKLRALVIVLKYLI